jgi:hypothetical protein
LADLLPVSILKQLYGRMREQANKRKGELNKSFSVDGMKRGPGQWEAKLFSRKAAIEALDWCGNCEVSQSRWPAVRLYRRQTCFLEEALSAGSLHLLTLNQLSLASDSEFWMAFDKAIHRLED